MPSSTACRKCAAVLGDAEEPRPAAEQPGGQRALQRVGRGEVGEPGGDRGGREAVVGQRDQHGLEDPGLRRRRPAQRDQPERQLAEADLAHQVGGEVLAEQPDLVGASTSPARSGTRSASLMTRRRLDSHAPDLVAVLVERRGRQPVVGRRLGERDRVAHRRHRGGTLAHLDHRVEPDLLGERDAAVDGVDRPARHAGGDDRRGTTPSSVRVASRSTSSGRSSSRLAVRSSLRAKRGSSASSGTPSTSTSLRNWPLLPAVMISSPSAHGSGS